VHFFGGDKRKTLAQIETHLVPKHAARAGAGAVGLQHSLCEHMAHEVFVGGGDGMGKRKHHEILKGYEAFVGNANVGRLAKQDVA
jgi:hypothetical protein